MFDFKLIFSGLVLFALQMPCDQVPKALLIDATWARDSTCARKLMPVHKPMLVFEEGDLHLSSERLERLRCRRTERGAEEGARWVRCDISGLDLCIRPLQGNRVPLRVVDSRGPEEVRPNRRNEAGADWSASLKEILGEETKLRADVCDPASSGSLVAAGVRLDQGRLTTREHTRRDGELLTWPFEPQPEGYRERVLAEELELYLPGTRPVMLHACDAPDQGPFWIFRGTQTDPVEVYVVNHRPDTAAVSDDLDHFLWYYELVDWGAAGCPDRLPIPQCPGNDCTTRSSMERKGSGVGGNGQLCPPTTYP